jgi:hypothetical protein
MSAKRLDDSTINVHSTYDDFCIGSVLNLPTDIKPHAAIYIVACGGSTKTLWSHVYGSIWIC